ncbi:hypothetical protein D9758_011213 [Tetrapyrgos nigripes]|uniref:Uncharacterized protein n=1 Tax=Tetrapyrgos nigripes TaxID=182062 RepID=A0A8H5D7C7_9AGAR|nr:hypothetical protein D9758_011213 [Tetrapyrgos nigripes]
MKDGIPATSSEVGETPKPTAGSEVANEEALDGKKTLTILAEIGTPFLAPISSATNCSPPETVIASLQYAKQTQGTPEVQLLVRVRYDENESTISIFRLRAERPNHAKRWIVVFRISRKSTISAPSIHSVHSRCPTSGRGFLRIQDQMITAWFKLEDRPLRDFRFEMNPKTNSIFVGAAVFR